MIGRSEAGRMVALAERAAYTDRLSAVDLFSDYCPNGWRVWQRSESGLPPGGVTAGSVLARRRHRSAAERSAGASRR